MSKRRKFEPVLVEGIVEDLSHDGMGVVKVEEHVWFVDGVLPGESIEFWTGRKRRSHGTGKLERLLTVSDDRTDAPCEHFGVCGGCALQHMRYEAQLAMKQERLLQALQRLGEVEPEQVQEPIFAASHGYRRRARLGVRNVEKKGGILVGFRERQKSYVTPLNECHTMHAGGAAVLVHLADLVSSLSVINRLPQIEVACGDNATALVFRHLDPLTEQDQVLLRNFADEHQVQVHLQPKGLDTVWCLQPSNAEPLNYRHDHFDVTIEFAPTDFVQVNGDVNELLVKKVIETIDLAPSARVADLFCGLGNFSLPLARSGASVLGIEGEQGLVDGARKNAELNQISGCDFQCADLFDESALASMLSGTFDCVVIDPPRSGALEVIQAIGNKDTGKFSADKIAYVSCNPATLARDAGLLVNSYGYRLSEVTLVDMFPHTAHIESFSLFER